MCSCPRDWLLSASSVPDWVQPWSLSIPHNTIVLRGLSGALNWSPNMPRDVSLWYSKFLTWQNWILIKLWYICPCSVITIFVSSINLFYSIILKKLLEMHSKTQFSAGRQFPLLSTILNSLFLSFFFQV